MPKENRVIVVLPVVPYNAELRLVGHWLEALRGFNSLESCRKIQTSNDINLAQMSFKLLSVL